jgi:type I restriction-modification system DNA methylase subunit
MDSYGAMHMPSFMKNGTGFQAILWFRQKKKLRDRNVGINDGREGRQNVVN